VRLSPRILLLTAFYHPFLGGVETHARELARYLSNAGFSITIVTKRAGRDTPIRETLDGVPVYRTHPGGARTGLRKWLMLPFAFARIVALRNDVDLIYCPGYQGIGLAALAAGRVLRRPVVLRSGNIGVLAGGNIDAPLARWGFSGDSVVARQIKRLLRRVYTSAEAFACNSREIEREALDFGVCRSRVHYLPNAVDVERFRPAAPGEKDAIRRDAGWPVDAIVCLYVGRLSVEKGVIDLLQAWRELDRPAVLVLVGPDMPGNPLDAGPAARAYAAEHRLTNVIFHGRSDDVPRLLRAADLAVQPSHYEAFSNAVIEAMATGLPIVASRVSGMQDCLRDDYSGLLSAPEQPTELTRQLRRAIDDPALRARLGQAARSEAVQRFSRDVVFDGFAALFRQVHAARQAH
jgi:glycosyltransferase involved in cell wall biosynthesis